MAARWLALASFAGLVGWAIWPRPPLAAASGGSPVLVELFTSQGCSSCPPADRLLSALGSEPGIVALSFHVDYWNTLGWSDPFSRAEWSRRQEAYARALGARGVYTPQAVVAGTVEAVGSDALAMRAAIARAAARPAADLQLGLTSARTEVRTEVTVNLPLALRGRSLALWLAVYENGLETAVGRGENAGRALRNDHVVRSLTRAGLSRGGPTWRVNSSLPISPDWKPERLGVAAWLADEDTGEIEGAVSARIGESDP